MSKLTSILGALILLSVPLVAQDNTEPAPPPCAGEEFRQFDSWLGEWELSWGEGEDAGTGTNIITRELGGCVIEENFTAHGEKPFIGNSVSVYRPATGQWHQTWVDNAGNYLDFEGEFADGKMILYHEAERGGEKFLQRMVFYNIKENSLDWNWEKSTDSGKSWQLQWKIHYERKR